MSATASRWWPFWALAAGAVPLLLWLGRDLTFGGDDCVFLTRSGDLLAPHNEHWMTVPLLAWKGVQAISGTGSYLPFHVLLLLVYAGMVAGVYALLRGLYALGAVALLWFLGSGSDQLMWAVQISFVGSLAFGMWALWAIERDRYPLAAGLLVLAVASSGLGLPMVGASIALGLLRRQRDALWLALPVVIYGAWYLAYGSGSSSDLLALPGFVARQVAASTHVLTGLPAVVVLVPIALVARRSRDPLVLAAVVGIIAEFAIIGLVRTEGAPRYQTTFAALSLLAVGRMRWPPLARPIGYAVLGLALLVNVGSLIAYRYEFALWYPTHSCAALGY